jgi:uncharacterized protein YbjT (DUF2867 family)
MPGPSTVDGLFRYVAFMLLITAARGNIGRELVRLLHEAGHKVRAMSREPAKARFGAGVEVVTGDFTRPDTLPAALAGVDKAFFATEASPELARLGGHFVDAAKAAGVHHVVAVSSGTIAMQPPVAIGRWHLELEERLKSSGLACTFLRPGNFASNTLRWAHTIRTQGAVYAPHGSGTSTPIDPRDIAAVAFHVLTRSGHEGKTYTLTGPDPLTPQEQVERIAKAIGKPLRFVEVPEEGARQGMAKSGMPAFMVEAILELIRGGTRAGAGVKTSTVLEVTGQEPRAFDEWAKDNAAAFV